MVAGVTLPAFPMARHWTDLAMIALRSGFEAMIDPEGAVTEPSYHRRLEILTLALVLMPVLKGRPDLAPLADILDLRLARAWGGLIALLEPDGALPPSPSLSRGVLMRMRQWPNPISRTTPPI